MIESHVADLLKCRGGSIAEMAEGAGLAYSVAWKLCNRRTERISFAAMDRLCRYFDCGPGDLFEYRRDPNE